MSVNVKFYINCCDAYLNMNRPPQKLMTVNFKCKLGSAKFKVKILNIENFLFFCINGELFRQQKVPLPRMRVKQ